MKSNYGTSKFQRKKFWTHINSQSYAIKRYSLCNNLETWLVDRLFGRNKLWKMQNYWSSLYFCFTFNLRRTEIPKYIISIKHATIYMVVETVCMQSSLDIGLTRHIFSANCFNHKAIKIKFHFGLAWIKNLWKITVTIEGTKTIARVPFSQIVELYYWLISKLYFLEADIRSSPKFLHKSSLTRDWGEKQYS